MPLPATWTDVEGIMLSEISPRQISHDITYMWKKKKKLIDSESRLVFAGGGRWGVGDMAKGSQKAKTFCLK